MGQKTTADPTGQATNRARSTKRLQSRLTAAKMKVITRVRLIPKTRIVSAPVKNAEGTPVYTYDLTAEQLLALNSDIRRYVNEELGTEADYVPADWFWRADIELPYRQGVTEEVPEFNRNVVAVAALAGMLVFGMKPQPIAAETVLYSQAYRDALNNVFVTNYGNIKSLSQKTADQVIQRINVGIKARKTPTEITDDIVERFNVAESSAKTIAETSINEAYTDAKMDATDLASKLTGLRSAVRHISALMPTTRDSHAVRHGRVYSIADQRKWWDTSPNRINCHCTVISVLLDESGNVVTSGT